LELVLWVAGWAWPLQDLFNESVSAAAAAVMGQQHQQLQRRQRQQQPPPQLLLLPGALANQGKQVCCLDCLMRWRVWGRMLWD